MPERPPAIAAGLRRHPEALSVWVKMTLLLRRTQLFAVFYESMLAPPLQRLHRAPGPYTATDKA